ncbi:thioredoxin [Nitrospira sp.]|nr:thioredoxin [Nitrospira sp.]
MIPDVTDSDFERIVECSSIPALVEFWQPGCGHCRALLTQLERLQDELEGRVLITKLNVQEHRQVAAELEITSLPALALYTAGRFQRFIGGIGTKEAIRQQLEAWL